MTDKTGVYTITNTINGKIYVGSAAVNFTNRWCDHKKLLNKNCHYNNHLQSSWNKYGKDNFKFEVLECTEPDLAVNVEQYWMNSLRPEYNKNPVAGSRFGAKLNKEQRLEVSRRQGGKPFEIWKNGTLLEVFDLQKDCADKYNLTQSKISKCLKGLNSHTKGFKFKYVGEDFTYIKKPRKKHARLKDDILVINKQTKVIEEIFNGVYEITNKYPELSSSCIHAVLSGFKKSYKNKIYIRLGKESPCTKTTGNYEIGDYYGD